MSNVILFRFRFLMLVFLCFAALGTTCNCEKKYAENSSCPNSLRKDYQKIWNEKKGDFPEKFWNEINDSLRTGQVTMLPLESMPSLNFDSILENTFNPFVAKNFNDSLLRATRFIAWHAISQDFFGSDNSVSDSSFLLMTLREQFENFEPKKKGLISIQCGGYSMYLGNFLNAAGINSYSFEIPDLHILRLVYDRSKKKYCLIDAQFLRILTDNNGELIDIRDALQRIKRFRDNKALDIGVLWKSIAYPDCSRHIVSNCTCIYSSTTWNFGKKSKLYSINNSNVLQDAICKSPFFRTSYKLDSNMLI